MQEILATAHKEMIPWLAIAAFAGLRTAEIQRLEWSEVNLSRRHIEIKAGSAKTTARRLAPVANNLAAWLVDHVQASGKVMDYTSWWHQFSKLTARVNRLRKRRGDLRVLE